MLEVANSGQLPAKSVIASRLSHSPMPVLETVDP